MKYKNIIPLFLLSYFVGGLVYLMEGGNVIFYLMALFAYINVMSIFHPVVFSNGVMRPLQLSVSSAGLLSWFTSDYSHLSVYLLLLFAFIFIELENLNVTKTKVKNIYQKYFLNLKMLVATVFLPFCVTYIVLLFGNDVDLLPMGFVILYFSAMFVVLKMYSGVTSYLFFGIIQLILMFKINDTYFVFGRNEMYIFAIGMLLFLFIGYGRKGLLNYANNY